MLGAAQQNAGENNQALESFSRAAKLQPQNTSPLLRLAGVQALLKDYDGAIKTLHRVIELQPDLTPAWLVLSSVYVTSDRVADGIANARKLQKAYPNRAVGYALEGQMLLSQKKPAEAAAVFREGLSREPVPFLSVMTYAALQTAGKPDQAAAMAQRWQKDHPKDTQLLTYQAQQSLAAKDYKAAAQYTRAVLEVDPDNVTMLNNLAWSLNELGDPKSVEVAERAYALGSSVPMVVDTLGWILVQRGDATRGLELLREASRPGAGRSGDTAASCQGAAQGRGQGVGQDRTRDVGNEGQRVARAHRGAADAQDILTLEQTPRPAQPRVARR